MSKGNIIVLGGAGFIGSHTCLQLSEAGYTPIVVDDLSRGHRRAVQWGEFHQANIHDTARVAEIFNKYGAAAVIHFAALIEVGESVKDPGAFYKNNVTGAQSVLDAMVQSGISNIAFSSTAAVYGQVDSDQPLQEDRPLNPINPYGNTKLAAERMIRDYDAAHGIKSVCLRYFNACGADPEARIGEMHYPETHLVPLVIQRALGLRNTIAIFGDDYATPDGTCVRDYVHVNDLAKGHIKAVEYLMNGGTSTACNLGTGTGYSVKEIMDAVKRVTGIDFPVEIHPRRAGDPAFLVADNTRADKVLGWKPEIGLDDIIADAVRWHKTEAYQTFWKAKTAAPKP